jgi:hypothetical protein
MIRQKGGDEKSVSARQAAIKLKPDDEESGGMITQLMR